MDAPERARAQFSAWRAAADDWFDPHLRSLLGFHEIPTRPLGAGIGDVEALAAFARVCADEIDPLVKENNRDENLPVLRRYDAHGNRVEAIVHHPTYHEIGRRAYAPGAMTLYGAIGREREAMARLYLFAQNGEAGHACPMACTAGLIKALRAAGDPRPDWMERLVDPDYDRHYIGAQFLTEVQGGSDVGANAVVATDLDDGSSRISGEKWFCSVIDADLFLMTARPTGASGGTAGLRGYVVPRRLDDGSVNGFRIRRLKYKLGTRSMASAEVDFDGAWAVPIADFRTVLEEVIDTSRLLNAGCCGAILERVQREATAYASTRTAFGRPIAAFPAVATVLASLRTEAYAARGLTFALAALGDRIAVGRASDPEKAAHRVLVNLNKLWTSLACTAGVRSAIEVLGGNGAIEEFSALPRLLRDAIVLEAWEGGHNVLCSQVLKDCQRYGLHHAMFDWLAALGAPSVELDAIRARWVSSLAGDAAEAAWVIRSLCEELRPIAQAAALTAESRHPGADPRLGVVIDQLVTTTRRGWDPLADRAAPDRVRAILA
ncbi:MAG: acyl-CoA dehydrogenase family protein [Myxococcota bacterium]